jgi:RHS repeat-associated protein
MVAVYADDDQNPGEPGDLVSTTRYDGLNRRIQKVVEGDPDVTYDYYYSGYQVVEVRKDGDTDPMEQYVWDIRYVHAPVLLWRDTTNPPDGNVDETLYYCNDANFNVTALVDVFDGAVVERYMYDPYGKPTVLNGVRDSTGTPTTQYQWTPRSTNTFQNAILYSGYYFDDESGLYSVRHRYYDFALGRWTSRDWDYYEGMNLYEYVGGSPTVHRDAYGLSWEMTPGRIIVPGTPPPSFKPKPTPALSEEETLNWPEAEPLKRRCPEEVEYLCKRVSFGFWHEGYPEGRELLAGAFERGRIIEVQSVAHMLKTLDVNLGVCECVKTLTIVAHGGSEKHGGFRMWPPGVGEQGNAAALAQWVTYAGGRRSRNVEAFSTAIKDVMCSDCIINIMSCSGAAGQTLQIISNITGCRVRGDTGTPEITTWPWGTGWKVGGEVKEFSPDGKDPTTLYESGTTWGGI